MFKEVDMETQASELHRYEILLTELLARSDNQG